MKPVWYTAHARGQLRQRGITRQQVRRLMAEGERRSVEGGDFEVHGRINRRKAVLVYNEKRRAHPGNHRHVGILNQRAPSGT